MNPQRIKITGGPSPRDITALIDGQKAESVSRIELVLDVNDAVRAKVTHIAQVVFDGTAVVTDEQRVELKTRAAAPGGEEGDIMWVTTHVATAATKAAALRDIAAQLDAEERERASGQ